MLAILLTACASTRVEVENEAADVGGRPPVVLVQRFGWNVDEVTENQGFIQQTIDASQSTTANQRSAEIARQVSERLADELVGWISSFGLDARRWRPGDDVPRDGLLITATSSTSMKATACSAS